MSPNFILLPHFNHEQRFGGQNLPPLWEFFFNLLGFLKKKIPKHPKFSRSYLPRKISGYAPDHKYHILMDYT